MNRKILGMSLPFTGLLLVIGLQVIIFFISKQPVFALLYALGCPLLGYTMSWGLACAVNKHWYPFIPKLGFSRYEKRNSHLGWRYWIWDKNLKTLRSPYRGTLWQDETLTEPHFPPPYVKDVRGARGIHARLMNKKWMLKDHPDFDICTHRGFLVTGVVERFGAYQLGTDGWRTETAVIKTLRCRTEELAAELRQKYPLAEVIIVKSGQKRWPA